MVWLLALPLAFSVMDAQPIALLALLYLLSSGNDVLYAPLSLLALIVFMAVCLWLVMLMERGRSWLAPRGLDGFVVTVYILLWVVGLVAMIWFQVSIFIPAVSPIIGTGAGVTASASCFTWLYLRAIAFARVSAPRNERTHRWLLTSFKWELAAFALLLLLGASVADKATYFSTSLIALPLFIVAGLVTVGLARQATLIRQPSYAAATAAPQAWYRLLGLFAGGAILALILFEALLLSGALGALVAAVAPLISAISGALGHLFGALGAGISHLQSHQSQPTPAATPSQGTGSQSGTSASHTSSAPMPISGLAALAILIGIEAALLGGALLLALWRRRLTGIPAAAPLRRTLGIIMWVLVALAVLLALLVVFALLTGSATSGAGGAHTLSIPLPGGGSFSIQLPFAFPSFGQPGRGTTTPQNGSHTTPANPLAVLLLILEIIAALGAAVLVIALVVLAVVGVRRWLRWRRAHRVGGFAAPTADPQAPAAAPQGDAARVYYRRLLQAAAAVGGEYARQPAETPREYAARLRPLLARSDAPPQLRQAAAPLGGAMLGDETSVALDELTSAYRVARYRGDPTDDDHAARLRPWLARLLAALGA